MLKMKFRTLILIGILTLVWAGSALAAPFVNPPPFTPQRNIMWDFDINPTITPTSYNDPNADVHYQGPDDPFLWTSDYVELTGAVNWDSVLGVIGIDNSLGTDPLFGEAIFHIDNWPDPNLCKHIWLEIETIQTPFTPPFGMIAPSLELPPGYTETGFWLGPPIQMDPLGDPNRYLQNDWWQVEPNPPWEEIVINFTALPGETMYLDSFHVATECDGVPPIPEPSTILLLGCGALGLFGIIIRNRRKQRNK